MKTQRWLVIYESTTQRLNSRRGFVTKAVVIDDDAADGTVKMPYGVEPEQVADDCQRILAITLCADPPHVPFVVIDDTEIELGQPNEDIPEAE